MPYPGNYGYGIFYVIENYGRMMLAVIERGTCLGYGPDLARNGGTSYHKDLYAAFADPRASAVSDFYR